MEFDINGYVIKKTDIISVDGLGKPPIRVSNGNYSGQDGGWLSSQFYGYRIITIVGIIKSNSCSDNVADRQDFMDALPIRQSLPVYITDNAGNQYYSDCYIADAKIDVNQNYQTEYQIVLIAPDPYLYAATGWIEQHLAKMVGGGYIFPYVLPVEWEPGATPAIITNSSSFTIYPQIILYDQQTNPKITNATTGEYIQINITTTTDDELVIDMKERTVTLNGGSVLPDMTGDWWGLVSGDNSIELTTDSGGDANGTIIRYRNAIEGL